MGIIDNLKKQYENEPWLTCNHCGVTFKGNHECDYEKLKEQNKRYKQALEFYADENNHKRKPNSFADYGFDESKVHEDAGLVARQVLEKE